MSNVTDETVQAFTEKSHEHVKAILGFIQTLDENGPSQEVVVAVIMLAAQMARYTDVARDSFNKLVDNYYNERIPVTDVVPVVEEGDAPGLRDYQVTPAMEREVHVVAQEVIDFMWARHPRPRFAHVLGMMMAAMIQCRGGRMPREKMHDICGHMYEIAGLLGPVKKGD